MEQIIPITWSRLTNNLVGYCGNEPTFVIYLNDERRFRLKTNLPNAFEHGVYDSEFDAISKALNINENFGNLVLR